MRRKKSDADNVGEKKRMQKKPREIKLKKNDKER